jgi:hypothetical protein
MDVAGEHQMVKAWYGILEIMQLDPSEGLMINCAQPDRSEFDGCSSYETGLNIHDPGAAFDDASNDFFA